MASLLFHFPVSLSPWPATVSLHSCRCILLSLDVSSVVLFLVFVQMVPIANDNGWGISYGGSTESKYGLCTYHLIIYFLLPPVLKCMTVPYTGNYPLTWHNICRFRLHSCCVWAPGIPRFRSVLSWRLALTGPGSLCPWIMCCVFCLVHCDGIHMTLNGPTDFGNNFIISWKMGLPSCVLIQSFAWKARQRGRVVPPEIAQWIEQFCRICICIGPRESFVWRSFACKERPNGEELDFNSKLILEATSIACNGASWNKCYWD